MTFEEIFNEDGQYTADDFIEGFCIEIKEGVMMGNQYNRKTDMFPEKWRYTMYKSLFGYDYKKVLNKQSLFKSETETSNQLNLK